MTTPYYEYVTLQGDTFDSIALDFYQEEHMAPNIINENPDYSDMIIMPAGLRLKIPIITAAESAAQTLPPWRRCPCS